MCFCSVNEDHRVEKSVFAVLAENGYKHGFNALDKAIDIFWTNIGLERLLNKQLKEFQFSQVLEDEFDILLVRNL